MLHYTGMPKAQAALERLCDPASEVSAHYVIEEDGTVHALVDEAKRAWHAGVSFWRGREGLNDISIGIEIVNPGHEFGYRDFPQAQIEALIPLCQQIVKRHSIEPWNVVAHADVAPDRKGDPGERFPWKSLAEAGIGLWFDPRPAQVEPALTYYKFGSVGPGVQRLQECLKMLGYYMKTDGFFGKRTENVVIAFQRHFVQSRFDGIWDDRSESVLHQLLSAQLVAA